MNNLPKIPQDETLFISNEGLEYIIKNYDPELPEKNFLWTTDYKVEMPIRLKKQGRAASEPYTLIEMWKNSLKKYADLAAINYEKVPGKWVTLSFRQYYNECIKFAKALIALKISQYSTVNIIGFNSVEWAVTFFGSIFGRYLPIGIYTSNGPQACEYIANHSECEVVVMEDRTHLKKYISILENVPKIKYFILYNDTVPEDLPSVLKGRVLTWAQLLAIGEKQYKPSNQTETLEYRERVQKPGNCATFIYTSGTTGPPKAVMISHDNYTWVSDAISHRFGFKDPIKDGKQRMISLLPLSHVAAQLVDLILAVNCGVNTFFTDPSALQGNLIKFMHVCRPTFFVSVPRVWEKMEEKLVALGAQTTGLKRKIADWAKGMSAKGTYAQLTEKPVPTGWSIAKKLVFNKIKQGLGIDKCEVLMFSAAPMRESTRQFFLNLNIFLHNCYGMSELSGPQTFTNPKNWSEYDSSNFLKEAGECIDGLEIAIDNPDHEGNGQICLRGTDLLKQGRNTFMGYFKNEKETKETIDNKGFVHSGDIGIVAINKCLSITGRIKELLITAGGENVAPVLIENQINTILPIFSQVVVIGDKQKYLTCLLCLKLKNAQHLSDQVVDYIKAKGSNAKTVQEAIKCDKLRALIKEGIDLANEKAISNAQKVQKFKILPLEFTVDLGLLTPTLKLKRKVVNQKFEVEIASLYIDSKL